MIEVNMDCLEILLREVFGGDNSKLEKWKKHKGGKNPELAARMWIIRHNAYHEKYLALVSIARECQSVVEVMSEMMESPLLAHLPDEETQNDRAALLAAEKGLERANKAVEQLAKYKSPITNC